MTRASYDDITDSDLDELIQEVVGGNDMVGPESIRATLRSRGIRIQRRRVRASIRRTNPAGAALRAMCRRPERRSYQVAGPNSLWHIDGNHKLIRWKIVIHGAIDGYSRLVVFLRASTNNRSSTVLDCFTRAVASSGVPSRIRTDRGGENHEISLVMDIFRGVNRGSAIQGTSVHNQRIERLWGDVWRGMTNVYYNLFRSLERDGTIDLDNEMHIWALHYIYVPRINRDLAEFAAQWNNHGLRTERHMSPIQIFVRGCLDQRNRSSTAMLDIFGGAGGGPAVAAGGGPAVAAAGPEAQAEQEEEDLDLASMLDWREEVDVPDVQYILDPEIMEQIRAQFDSLSGSRRQLGVGLLRNLIAFLNTLP